MKNKTNIYLILPLIVLFSACTQQLRKHNEIVSSPINKIEPPTVIKEAKKKTKNVILIIGDGMGPQQIGLLLSYARQASNPVFGSRVTAFDRMLNENGELGVSMTYAANTLVTDSAASATQIASGKFAGSEMIGADKEGNATKSIIKIAQEMNKSTGLVSDVRITHATPAAFAAHQMHRSMENEIAVDLINSNVDVMFSGGMRYFVPKSVKEKNSVAYKEVENMISKSFYITSKREDERNLLKEAQQKGYDLSFNKTELMNSKKKALGLFSSYPLASGISVKNGRNEQQPTLREMSKKAIEILSNNEDGFFLMIESGQIDWASHGNDTGMLLHEMIKINDTLEYILDWANKDGDTLVIVTADHETGGFGFSYSANDLPQAQKLHGNVFNGEEFKPNFNFGISSVLDKIYKQKYTYREIFEQFDKEVGKLEESGDLNYLKLLPAKLASLINGNNSFKISHAQAKRILEQEANQFYVDGHKYLGMPLVPKMNSNEAFFAYQEDNRGNLLAIELGRQQHVVWATGTHTSTPVLIFALGPNQEGFGNILHHTDIHSIIKEAWSKH